MPSRLILFAKAPVPGRAKTRLVPALGADGAARLYRAFLADTAEVVRRVRAADERELWVTAGPGSEEAIAAAGEGFAVRRQREGGLGDRLTHAFGRAFEEGSGRALVVGSDHPTLPVAYLERGLAALEEADLALGPSDDGGYYAVGLRRDAWPRAASLFEDIPWSTPRVLAETLRRAREAGLRVAELPEWYDVDEPGELDRLREDVDPGSRTAAVLGGRGPAGGNGDTTRANRKGGRD